MLEKLIVTNFAIIEDLTVDFNDKMTVLTGETGAGKSLIIDTISLLLGARADSDMIRYEKNMASITGIFSSNDYLNEVLNKYQIPIMDKITILREIYDSSKNVVKINNHSVNLVTLKNIAVYLADIHVQNDTYKLFNPDSYLEMLNPKDDKKYDKLISEYSKNLYLYNEQYSKYEYILNGQKKALERLDFLKYERDELEGLNLEENIDTILEETISKLSNFDKIKTSLCNAYNYLDDEYQAVDKLYDAGKELANISEFDANYLDFSEKILDSYYIISEIKADLRRNIDSLDYDEDELNNSIERLNDITKAKEKYKMSVKELIEHLKNITLQIDMVTNYDDVLNEAKVELKKAFDILSSKAIELSTYRKNIAKKLEKEIVKECVDLDLENTLFEIKFNDVDLSNYLDKSIFTDSGIDQISFMISFNKGEPLKPLHKVASGGEMSRIMLAFKSYLSKRSTVSLMVFDEIDTGVSGQTAKKIANKMHEIAQNTQVLCITHLPQVAAIGDYHKHIYKILENGRTHTEISDLSYKDRVEEIAMMLSGDKLSIYALEHAKSLLNK